MATAGRVAAARAAFARATEPSFIEPRPDEHDERLDDAPGAWAMPPSVGARRRTRRLATAPVRLSGRSEYVPARTGDVLHSRASLDQVADVLGYQPIVDFEEGLRQTIAWYRKALAVSER